MQNPLYQDPGTLALWFLGKVFEEFYNDISSYPITIWGSQCISLQLSCRLMKVDDNYFIINPGPLTQ